MANGGALTSPRPRNGLATYEIFNQTKEADTGLRPRCSNDTTDCKPNCQMQGVEAQIRDPRADIGMCGVEAPRGGRQEVKKQACPSFETRKGVLNGSWSLLVFFLKCDRALVPDQRLLMKPCDFLLSKWENTSPSNIIFITRKFGFEPITLSSIAPHEPLRSGLPNPETRRRAYAHAGGGREWG